MFIISNAYIHTRPHIYIPVLLTLDCCSFGEWSILPFLGLPACFFVTPEEVTSNCFEVLILSNPHLSKTWTLKHKFPSYVKSKQLAFPIELSLMNSFKPSCRIVLFSFWANFTLQWPPEGPFRVTESDSSFFICLTKCEGIRYTLLKIIKWKKGRKESDKERWPCINKDLYKWKQLRYNLKRKDLT